MKKLVINADDFGYREPINNGIIYAHKNGLVTSTSLFVEREGTTHAVGLAKETPTLGIGIHLDLDRYFDIDHQKGTIIRWADPRPDLGEIELEIKTQIEKFYSFGLEADHINSHHHSHLHPEVFPIASRLARKFRIPVVRLFRKFYTDETDFDNLKNIALHHGLKVADNFIDGWYWGNVDENYNIAELMTHPGYGELWRESELANCCQKHLKEYFTEQKIDLLRFSDIV